MATLITGASSGIGEEFTRRYAAQKHDLVLVARNKDKLNALADEMRTKHEIEVTTIPLDLSEFDAAERLWNETTRAGLEIDVLVNNAGFGTQCDVADDDPERLEKEVRLNCLAVVGITARYLSTMRERHHGTIINISSTAAFQPMPHMAVYGATKSFVLSFTEALWRETKNDGIRVLAVCPGSTDTSFFESPDGGIVVGKVGKLRSTKQVLDNTMRALKTNKPSFVDGLQNAFVARVVTRVIPTRIMLEAVERIFRR
ncbi:MULTISPECIES: SDR family NAD(P)-dependent oxidoreductase [Rothia]|nr:MULTISPECIES: SDR family oxidoreductase [Rothia]OFN45972.1 oxidoreductase [Rothia sp. HMSC071F11]